MKKLLSLDRGKILAFHMRANLLRFRTDLEMIQEFLTLAWDQIRNTEDAMANKLHFKFRICLHL